MMIQWDDKYRTGIPELDEQHKVLFQYINDFEDSLKQGDVGETLLIATLTFFSEYAKKHFGDEEECMHRFKCPIANANQSAHLQFIEFFNKYQEKLEIEGYNEAFFKEILAFTQQWLIEHICRIDTQLKPCVHPKNN